MDPAAADALVGRGRERHVLTGAIDELGRGAGASVLVSGEPAIGKTRLLRAAADHASGVGVAVTWGHTWPDVGAPALWPWVQVLRAVAADLMSGDAVRAGAGAPHLVSLVPELGPVIADRDDVDATAEHADFYLRDAAVSVLIAAARRRPRLVVLDDLHRADAASVQLAEHLVTATRTAPLCLVAARRDTDPAGERGAALVRLRAACRELPLEGLTPDECRELARVRFGRSLSSSEGRELYERTGGNPLFVEEVLEGGERQPAAPAGSVIQERLEALSAIERELVEVASVAGAALSPAFLSRVAGASAAVGTGADPAAVMATLRSLERTRLVRLQADGTIGFRHELVAEVTAERLEPDRRAGLHQAWAEALIDAWPGAREHPAVIAGHLLAARPHADPVETRRWARRAAEEAAERFAHDDAATWYEAALRTLPAGALGASDRTLELERCDLLLALGVAQLQGPGPSRAMVTYGEAVGAAERARDDVRRLRCLVWLSEARYQAPGINLDEAARVTLTAAIDAAPHAPPDLAALAAEQLSRVETFRGTSERAHAVAQWALDAAERTGDAEAMAAARRALRWALVGPFPLADKRDASHRLVDVLGRRSHPAVWWSAHAWMLLDAFEHGDRTEVDAELRSCRRLADRLREPFLASLTTTWETTVALLEGRHSDAERMIAAALDAADRYGLNTGGLHAQLAVLAFDRGETAAFADLVRAVADAVPDRSALYRAVLAAMYSEQGRVEEATFELDHLALDGFSHVPRDGEWLTTLGWCAIACVRLDRPDIARDLRPLLLPFRDRNVVAGGLPYLFMGAVAYYTGALAVTTGEPDAALDDLDGALARHERMRARPWVAYTRLEQGRARLARQAPGDASQAGADLASVARESEALGMAALGARAANLADAPPPSRPTLAPQGDGWLVAFSGAPFHLPDSRGLRVLYHLVGRPGVRVSATALVAEVSGDGASAAERDRVNVTRQLRSAIDRIGEHDAALRAHLRSAVATGRECCYRPSEHTLSWRLGTHRAGT
jgi:hypothetical protein